MPRRELNSGRFLGTALVLVACTNPRSEPVGHTSAPIAWVTAGTMSVERPATPAVVVLPSGSVFVAGGNSAQTQAELWDPSTRTFSKVGTTDIPVGRDAMWLGAPTNKVFVPIGNRGQLWDPTTKTFSAVPSDDTEISDTRHVRLDDGRILRTGGRLPTDVFDSTCEIWDPASGLPDVGARWTATGSMHHGRNRHAIAKMSDGRVIVAGGFGNDAASGNLESTAEIYDPSTGTWTEIGALPHVRTSFEIIVTPANKVIAIGGRVADIDELETATNTWSKVGSLSEERYGHAVVVKGNLAYAMGAYDSATVDTIDLTTYAVSKTVPDMLHARQFGIARLLGDGTILMVGGIQNEAFAGPGWQDVELLDPTAVPDAGTDATSADAGETGTATDTGTDVKPEASTAPIDSGNAGTPVASGPFQTCHTGSECATGFCVEGVCCDTKCDQACHSCALPSSPGKCSVEPLGLDLKAECGAARACTGTCGGDGSCIAARAGATCAPPHCTGHSTGVGPVTCVAENVACNDTSAAAFDCGPYACEQSLGACRSFCTESSQCADGYLCDVGSQRCNPVAPMMPDSGCGCSTPGSSQTAPWALLVAAMMIRARTLWSGTRGRRRKAGRAD